MYIGERLCWFHNLNLRVRILDVGWTTDKMIIRVLPNEASPMYNIHRRVMCLSVK